MSLDDRCGHWNYKDPTGSGYGTTREGWVVAEPFATPEDFADPETAIAYPHYYTFRNCPVGHKPPTQQGEPK